MHQLSKDELDCILEFCDLPSVLALQLTNKTLNELSSANKYWYPLLACDDLRSSLIGKARRRYEMLSNKEKLLFELPDFEIQQQYTRDGHDIITKYKLFRRMISSERRTDLELIRPRLRPFVVLFFPTLFSIMACFAAIAIILCYGFYLDKTSGPHFWVLPFVLIILLVIVTCMCFCVAQSLLFGYTPIVSEIVRVTMKNETQLEKLENDESTVKRLVLFLFGTKEFAPSSFVWSNLHALALTSVLVLFLALKQVSVPGKPCWSYFLIPYYVTLLLVIVNSTIWSCTNARECFGSVLMAAIFVLYKASFHIISYSLLGVFTGCIAAKIDGFTTMSWGSAFSPMFALMGFLICISPCEALITNILKRELNRTTFKSSVVYCNTRLIYLCFILSPVLATLLLIMFKLTGNTKLTKVKYSFLLIPLYYLVITSMLFVMILGGCVTVISQVVKDSNNAKSFDVLVNESSWINPYKRGRVSEFQA